VYVGFGEIVVFFVKLGSVFVKSFREGFSLREGFFFLRELSKIPREGFFLLTFLRELSKIPREGFF
jgi:hypothetical protein